MLATMRVGIAPSEAPLFVSPHGTLVVRSEVVKAIRWLAEWSGLPAAEFAGHSLQRGGATSPLMAGASILVIQALGRWRSESFHHYLEAPDCCLAQQMARMAPSATNGTPGWSPDYARPWVRGSLGWTARGVRPKREAGGAQGWCWFANSGAQCRHRAGRGGWPRVWVLWWLSAATHVINSYQPSLSDV